MNPKKLEKLSNLFLDSLLEDIQDRDKCTPGLYLVIRGILNDHKTSIDTIPNQAMREVEETIRLSLPFRLPPIVITEHIEEE